MSLFQSSQMCDGNKWAGAETQGEGNQWDEGGNPAPPLDLTAVIVLEIS